ncbi:MAG TPA: hypothetical protein VHV82_05465 [Sporichthyaceae bacterium]|nr:hypothetical protein [Sporichthyaceae bacterium]
MSAFGIGMTYVRGRAAAPPPLSVAPAPDGTAEPSAEPSASSPKAGRGALGGAEDAFRILLDWVPVEVLGAYAALITSLGGGWRSSGTSGGWLALFCVLGAVATFLGATTALRTLATPVAALGRGLGLRAVLCAVAVFLWSWILPGSATNVSGAGRHNGAAVVILVVLCAVVFGLSAQYLVERFDAPRRPRRPVEPRSEETLVLADLPVPPPVSIAAAAPILVHRPAAVGPGRVDDRDLQTRLLCASFLAASNIPDGPMPDSPTLAYLTDSAPIQQSDPRVLSAWASGVRCLMINTLGGVVVAFGAALPDPGGDARRSVTDWISAVDADLVVHRWFTGRVHAGFARELDRLWDRLEQQLRTRLAAAGPGAVLWMTGHGIGGGLANLAAARFSAAAMGTPRVRTFGGARPGDGEFASSYARLVPDSVRQEYGNDLVPHLPLGTEFAARLGNLEFIEQLSVYLHRDFQPVGNLRYTSVDGSVLAASDPLNLNRHRSLAAIITTGNFGVLMADHDGRPGGGYFRTLREDVAAGPAPHTDRPIEPDDAGARARRWPRRDRKHSHLQTAGAENPRASVVGG